MNQYFNLDLYTNAYKNSHILNKEHFVYITEYL